MNEHVDPFHTREQTRQPAAARSPNQGPSVLMALTDCNANLRMEVALQWRQIDAPQVPSTVALECLKDEARRDSVTNTSFDDRTWFQVSDQAPDRPRQPCIAVVPPFKCFRTG